MQLKFTSTRSAEASTLRINDLRYEQDSWCGVHSNSTMHGMFASVASQFVAEGANALAEALTCGALTACAKRPLPASMGA